MLTKELFEKYFHGNTGFQIGKVYGHYHRVAHIWFECKTLCNKDEKLRGTRLSIYMFGEPLCKKCERLLTKRAADFSETSAIIEKVEKDIAASSGVPSKYWQSR